MRYLDPSSGEWVTDDWGRPFKTKSINLGTKKKPKWVAPTAFGRGYFIDSISDPVHGQRIRQAEYSRDGGKNWSTCKL